MAKSKQKGKKSEVGGGGGGEQAKVGNPSDGKKPPRPTAAAKPGAPTSTPTKQKQPSKLTEASRVAPSTEQKPPSPQILVQERTSSGASGGGGSKGDITTATTKDGIKKLKNPRAKSMKYIGIEPDWNSDELRSTKLITDGFSCCIVLIMEESSKLSNYTTYLHQAVGTGVRRNFTSIDGRTISQKVRKYMTSMGYREAGIDDTAYQDRIDLWAEAIKHTLIQHKGNAVTELQIKAKEEEITGARSKEFIKFVPQRAFLLTQDNSEDALLAESQTKTSSAAAAAATPSLPPTTTEQPQSPQQQKARASLATPQPQKRASLEKGQKSRGKKGELSDIKIGLGAGGAGGGDNVGAAKISKPTLLRKRGEMPMPVLDFVEDSPPNGPQRYFFLQGFYNPELIEQLQAIDVNINCILLITAETLNKRNFSSLDIEQNIAGTFRPHNILPDYLKIMEKNYNESKASSNSKENDNEVTHFWIRLAELINQADANSSIHDIALMNCSLPTMERIPETIDQIGLFAAQLFDEAAHRIYEMLVLTEWYNEYKMVATRKELHPIEPALPTTLYDRLLNELPAECITVPIIMECLIEQVIENEKGEGKTSPRADEDEPSGASDGGVDWDAPGLRIPGTNTITTPEETITALQKAAVLPSPNYIKNYDFASIRSCHLNKNFASHVASAQVLGEFHSIQQLLWNRNMPEYNKGLCMKLLGNLNHFMHFLPPGAIKFDDMFYVLHLLMAAGIELEIQKQSKLAETELATPTANLNSEQAQDISVEQNKSMHGIELSNLPKLNELSELNLIKTVPHHERSAYVHHPNQEEHHRDHHQQSSREAEEKLFQGTKLQFDHNYLMLQEPASKTKFILVPRTESKLEMTKLANRKLGFDGGDPKLSDDEEGKSVKSAMDEFEPITKPGGRKTDATHVLTHKLEDVTVDPQNQIHAAVIATEQILETGPQLNNYHEPTAAKRGTAPYPTPPNTATKADSNEAAREIHSPRDPNSFASYFNDGNDTNGKRFIACEEQWFDSINDSSVLEKLLACPALLTLNENGALDLSSWVSTYLSSSNATKNDEHNFTTTLSNSNRGLLGRNAPFVGSLENWNYVEQLASVQLVQALSESLASYLCVDRMYCPFYDTIVFIFSNPRPESLKTDTEFYSRLHTLPGLQHFLEYSINEDHVLDWLLNLEKNKGVEIVDTFSVTTLMRLVPRDQWLLIPSIKWALYRAHKEQQRINRLPKELKLNSRQSFLTDGEEEEEEEGYAEEGEEEEEDEEFGQLKKDKKKSLTNNVKEMRKPSAEKESRKSMADYNNNYKKQSPPAAADGIGPDERRPSKNGRKFSKNVLNSTAGSQYDERSGTSEFAEAESSGRASRESGDYFADANPFRTEEENEAYKKFLESGLLDEAAQIVTSDTSFNFTDAIKESMGLRSAKQQKKGTARTTQQMYSNAPHFNCYDLGKRVLIAASDTYHLFPMDGTLISYEISSIDPDFHMMQLSVKKNNYSTYFYPYYIPHDMDLSTESYVVCPYFHMVHANGTLFSFQDKRAGKGEDPYAHFVLGHKHPQTHPELFSIDKNVIFSDKLYDFLPSSTTTGEDDEDSSLPSALAGRTVESITQISGGEFSGEGHYGDEEEEEEEERGGSGKSHEEFGPDGKAMGKGKKGKGKKGGKDTKEKHETEDKKAQKKSKLKPGKKKGKASVSSNKTQESEHPVEEPPHDTGTPEKSSDRIKDSSSHSQKAYHVKINAQEEDEGEGDEGGEWKYPSSENTEGEEEEGGGEDYYYHRHSTTEGHFEQGGSIFPNAEMPIPTSGTINWDEAVQLLQPMTHSFHITFPSGLFLSVDDVSGPPLRRTIKQTYAAKGSASSLIEKSRYCTMNGSVIKFLYNKTIQILTARGVTTTIQELKAHSSDPASENAHQSFKESNYVRVYKGDVILPTGEHWRIKRGKKFQRDPLFVFTSGVLPNGEIFRRRQDGVVHLHRHDGTTITHYPDGTRFTTRMVIAEATIDEEFSDWVFIGLKHMIEHPNYSTVLTNSVSGNIHLRMAQGEWARIFADGSIKIGTKDEYKLDIDQYRAIITNPSCGAVGDKRIPNLVAVKLWHAHEYLMSPEKETKSEEMPSAFKSIYSFSTAKLPPESTNTPKFKNDEIGSEDDTEKLAKPTQAPEIVIERKSAAERATTKAKKRNKPKPRKIATQKDRQPATQKSLRKSAEQLAELSPKTSQLQRPPSIKSIPIAPPAEGDNFLRSDEEAGEEEEGEGAEMNSNSAKLARKAKKFEIDEFLQFTDMWTFCKALDCWDNRFTVDIFGDTVVDKCDLVEEKQMNSTKEKLVSSLSSQFELPRQYVSGILRSTSSEQLSTLLKRQAALSNMTQLESCSKLPPTRIFVVKRNLSGFEYLTKTNVDKMVTKAKSTLGSFILKTPIPSTVKKGKRATGPGSVRHTIQIMEPVQKLDCPHGLWKSEYREPVFRPRFLANKQLKIANPADLRWFSYVVTRAHIHRPKFLLSPKETYLKNREAILAQKQLDEEKAKKAELERLEEEEAEEEEAEIIQLKEVGSEVPSESKPEKHRKHRKGSIDRANTVIKPKTRRNSLKRSSKDKVQLPSEVQLKTRRRSKRSRKSLLGSELISTSSLLKPIPEESIPTTAEAEEEYLGEGEEGDEPFNTVASVTEKNLENVVIPEYPKDIPDIKDIYGLDKEDEYEIRAQFHPDIEPTRKSIVVRNIVEIPCIDKKMERALLAASLSYSKTIEAQKRIYKSYEIQDDRTQEQKDEQKLIKQRLLEQNLEQMHLFEQKEGKLLQFHL